MNWVADATVLDKTKDGGRDIWTFSIDTVYYEDLTTYSGEGPANPLLPGDVITAVTVWPLELKDGDTVIAVLGATVPDSEVDATAQLVTDREWTPTAPAWVAEGVAEAMESYEGTRQQRLLSVVADARAFTVLRYAQNHDGTGSSPTTPGPLGEWRRTEGWESTGRPNIDVAGWADRPVDDRSFGMVVEELPDEAAQALGIEGWRQIDFTTVVTPDLENYTYIALRYPGLGLVGPYGMNEPGELMRLMGPVPIGHGFEVVVWTGPREDMSEPTVLATVDEPEDGAVVWYENGEIEDLTKDEAFDRIMDFLGRK